MPRALGGEAVDADRAFTGRCNLFAASAGVLVVDKDAIDAINRIDEAITFATLPAFKPVVAGEMIGTVKIIPFAVSERSLSAALKIAAGGEAAGARRAVSHQESRHRLDVASGPSPRR